MHPTAAMQDSRSGPDTGRGAAQHTCACPDQLHTCPLLPIAKCAWGGRCSWETQLCWEPVGCQAAAIIPLIPKQLTKGADNRARWKLLFFFFPLSVSGNLLLKISIFLEAAATCEVNKQCFSNPLLRVFMCVLQKTKNFYTWIVFCFSYGKNSNFYPGDACCMELFVFDKEWLFFFFLKLFTDKKYSKYCDLTNWKVWLIINVIICLVCGSSKIHGPVGIGHCAGSRADLVTVSGDVDVLGWAAWGWHPVFGKHPPRAEHGLCKGCQHSPPHELCRCSALLRRSVCEDLRVSDSCFRREMCQ